MVAYDLFDQLALAFEDVKQDLASLRLAAPIAKVADCGCGNGFTSLSLLALLRAEQLTGIDQNASAILQSQATLESLRSSPRSTSPETQKRHRIEEILAALERDVVISFQVGDILTGKNLPDSQDLSYCKRVLTPIYMGEYDNATDGPESVQVAIDHLSRTIKPNGHLLLIEKDAINFQPFLDKTSLNFVRTARYRRGDIGLEGRNSLVTTPYLAYLYTND